MVDLSGIGAQMQKIQTKPPQNQSGLANTGNQAKQQPANTTSVPHDKNFTNQSQKNDIVRFSSREVQIPLQEGKNLSELLKNAGALKKLSHFAGKGKSILSNAIKDLNRGDGDSQFITENEIDDLLSAVKNHRDSKIVQSAVVNLLRSVLSEQQSKVAKSKIQSIVDELSEMLKNAESDEMDSDHQVNKPLDAKTARSNLNLTSNLKWMKADPSSDKFRSGLNELMKSLPKDSKALHTITQLVHAVHTLDEAKHFDTSSSVQNLQALFSRLDEGDEMHSKLKLPLAIAEKLATLAKMPGALAESEEALAFIGKIKDLYAENATIQSLSSQILQGATTEDAPDQAMFHLLLKSLFNGEPHTADLSVESEGEDDGKGTAVTLFMETELQGVGNFEVELKLLDGNQLSIGVQCPEDYVEEMKTIRELVTNQVHIAGYTLPNVTVGIFEEPVTKADSHADHVGQRGDFIAKV